MTKLGKTHRKTKGTFFLILFFIFVGSSAAIFFIFFEGKPPILSITSPQTYIGSEGAVSFTARDGESGLQQIRLYISQGEKSSEIFEADYSRKGYTGTIGTLEEKREITFNPLKAGFSDGPALITLQASDFSARNFLKGNSNSITREIIIDTTAPKITILHSERYINPGGSGIVIYRVNDKESQNGLQINMDFHPGFLVGDGRDDTYIAYFGLRYDTAEIEDSFVIAKDRAGNQTKVPFSVIYKKANFQDDRINVGDGFLKKKIPEFEQYYPEMKGTMLDKYLYTNNDLRQSNNQQISDLCKKPQVERLWAGRFIRGSGSSRAGFADHRTYYYNSKAVDKQVHLGIDIASTRHADVKAAEKGLVVFADYLGIYGNMVLLDHGQGVFSLYSHLSQINVSPGDAIEQGIVLGLTGTSGMAGGDHLHFSMLVNGIFVTPKEWWDQHWIDVTIEDPLTESRFQ